MLRLMNRECLTVKYLVLLLLNKKSVDGLMVRKNLAIQYLMLTAVKDTRFDKKIKLDTYVMIHFSLLKSNKKERYRGHIYSGNTETNGLLHKIFLILIEIFWK